MKHGQNTDKTHFRDPCFSVFHPWLNSRSKRRLSIQTINKMGIGIVQFGSHAVGWVYCLIDSHGCGSQSTCDESQTGGTKNV